MSFRPETSSLSEMELNKELEHVWIKNDPSDVLVPARIKMNTRHCQTQK